MPHLDRHGRSQKRSRATVPRMCCRACQLALMSDKSRTDGRHGLHLHPLKTLALFEMKTCYLGTQATLGWRLSTVGLARPLAGNASVAFCDALVGIVFAVVAAYREVILHPAIARFTPANRAAPQGTSKGNDMLFRNGHPFDPNNYGNDSYGTFRTWQNTDACGILFCLDRL